MTVVQYRNDELVEILRPDFVTNDGLAAPPFVFICVGDGSAAAPGFRFCADPDTGLYRPAANELGITTGGTRRGIWNASGALILNDAAASTFMTGPGVTIQQGGLDNEAVAAQSTDVAHGMTTIADTGTYHRIQKAEGAAGGVAVDGFKDADGIAGAAAQLRGYLGENADTDKTTAGRAIVEVIGYIKSGTGIGNTNADGNVFGVRTHRGGVDVTLLLVDEDGDAVILGDLDVTGVITGTLVHVVNSTGPHAEAGLTIGHVLRVSGAAAFSFAQLQHADLGGVTANLHHNENHVLLSAPHTDTLAAAVVDGDVIIGNVTPRWSRLAIAVPAANVRNVLGIDNAELRPSWKTALDGVNPANIAAAAAPGTQLIFSHRDHVHAHPGALGANLHHTQIHDVVGGDHTLTGAQWNLVGATALNTIGLLTPSADVSGGVEAILKSTATGLLSLYALNVGTNAASSRMTGPGVTIQQGAYDDEAIAVKSTDVAHGITGYANTDTYFLIRKTEGVAGGAWLIGLKDADASAGGAMRLWGILGKNVDTTKTSAARAIIEVEGYIKSGTGVGNTNADGNVFAVRTRRGGVDLALLIVDEDADCYELGDEYLTGSHRQSVSVGVRVYRDATFAHNNTGNWLAIDFNQQRWDDPDDNQWVIGTPTRLTCQFDGIYVITGHIYWTGNATGDRRTAIRLNGGVLLGMQQHINLDANAICQSVATTYKLSVGDFLELGVWQNSGGNLNIFSFTNYTPEFSMVRVA